MAPQREAERLTGLEKGGISPLALMDKGWAVYMDETAILFDRIEVSAGKVGHGVIVPVEPLVGVGSRADLSSGPLLQHEVARMIVVLGDIAVDIVSTAGHRLAHGSDAPAEVRLMPGGSGANVAVWLARLGGPVTFIGRIGDDMFGRWLRDDLAAEGVQPR